MINPFKRKKKESSEDKPEDAISLREAHREEKLKQIKEKLDKAEKHLAKAKSDLKKRFMKK